MKAKNLNAVLLIAFVGLTITNCSTKINEKIVDPKLILGLASPIQLEPESTLLNMEDWILNYERIDSITTSEELELVRSGKSLEINGSLSAPINNLSFWSEGYSNDVLIKKSNKVAFSLSYEKSYPDLRVKGEFNAWNIGDGKFEQVNGKLTFSKYLNPGRYQYILLSEADEFLDPLNTDSIDNGSGGWNSLAIISGSNKEKIPTLNTVKYANEKVSLVSTNKVKGIFCYWNNQLINSYTSIQDNFIEISIPEIAKSSKRSFIRLWAYNEAGLSNDILIPLNNGLVLSSSNDLSREDKESNIMYFLMVDRFNNGNKLNDEPVADPSIHPKANYYGGDIEGVKQKIDDGYFKKLGINTIWLSPIAQNPLGAYGKYPDPETTFSAYHGYWPISSSQVDHRFGNDNALQDLVNTSHDSNFNIILDYVANHVHKEHPVYKNNPDWVTNLYLPDGSLNTEKWDEHRLTTWFDTFLPTLDLSKPEVVDPMTDSALYWLEKFNIDGFRHDATKHIPLIFWRELTKKVKSQVSGSDSKSILQIGETYGSRELISSYISSGMLDGQFDFNLYDDAVATFAREDIPFSRLTNSLKESINYYGDHNLMGYITGNQDRARFISYADGSVRFYEDSKKAGWTRKIEIQDSNAYSKLASLTAFMMTIPGIPVIYYGDEIGLPGGNDPDNRRMMNFDNLDKNQSAHLAQIKKVTQLRKTNLALIYGDMEIIKETDNLLVIRRNYFEQSVTALFNKSAENIILTANDLGLNGSDFKSLIQDIEIDLNKIPVNAFSFDMISN